MKLEIDTDKKTLTFDGKQMELYSKPAFEILSEEWLKIGFSQKYSYQFSWLGRPVIQIPEDMIRIQEVIYDIKPDVIIETGVAHGGSLIFSASLCKLLGKGRVIGIDIEIRPHNRKAIEQHELSELITLIEGSSIDSSVVKQVKSLVQPGESVLVILDSNHSKGHVLQELNAYHELVTPGSYIIAADGIMQSLSDVPMGKSDWNWNNPQEAVSEFLNKYTTFVMAPPNRKFNESHLSEHVSYWPNAWLKRVH